jgi:hypothetical protein
MLHLIVLRGFGTRKQYCNPVYRLVNGASRAGKAKGSQTDRSISTAIDLRVFTFPISSAKIFAVRRLLNTTHWRDFFIAMFALVAIAQAAFVLHEIIDQHELGSVCEVCVGHAQLDNALVSDLTLALQLFAFVVLAVASSQPNFQRRPVAVRSRSPPTL